MARSLSDAELDTMLLTHFAERGAEIIDSAAVVREMVDEVQGADVRGGRRGRWDVILATVAVLAFGTTAALLVASTPSPTPTHRAGGMVASASPTAGAMRIPILQPCPVASSSPCVDHGLALVNMWRDDGTMSAVTPWLTDASLGEGLDPFTLVFRQLDGDELRITSILSPGMRTNDPLTSIELSGPNLGPRADQAAAGCSVSISSVPPSAPLRGTFACGDRPYRGGSGTSGFFDASAAPGVAVVNAGGYLFEAGLIESSGSRRTSPSRLGLVYESPWGYWAGDAEAPDSPMTHIEISGSVGPDGTVDDPQVRMSFRELGTLADIDGCQVIIESSAEEVPHGAFRCPVDTDVLWWMEPGMPIVGTLTTGASTRARGEGSDQQNEARTSRPNGPPQRADRSRHRPPSRRRLGSAGGPAVTRRSPLSPAASSASS